MATKRKFTSFDARMAKDWFKRPRCKHRRSWLICGGRVEWCYQCGAWRQLATKENTSTVNGPWAVPSGDRGENPFEEFAKKEKTWALRRAGR